MDVAQLRRLEKESERFSGEIKQRESENKLLKDQIAELKVQIEESKKMYDGITKVSVLSYHCSPTSMCV